jgi:hypothetical protein
VGYLHFSDPLQRGQIRYGLLLRCWRLSTRQLCRLSPAFAGLQTRMKGEFSAITRQMPAGHPLLIFLLFLPLTTAMPVQLVTGFLSRLVLMRRVISRSVSPDNSDNFCVKAFSPFAFNAA